MAIPAELLPDGDVLLVVPPLAHLSWPSLGVHVLQACGREAGFEVGVFYANLLYASRIGLLDYAALANGQVDWLLGERLFAEAAFGTPVAALAEFGARLAADRSASLSRARRYVDQLSDAAGVVTEVEQLRFSPEDLVRYGEAATALVEELTEAIAARGYRVVGATTSFDQTAAAVALLAAVKARQPGVVTVIGGANCEGEMAHGVAALSSAVDHVFAGESEATFTALLDSLRDGTPPERVVVGAPCHDLDGLPTPDPGDYFAQVEAVLPELAQEPLWIAYESSRGCWWGETSHCTFCGLNGEGMGFREKSPERVLSDLRSLIASAPTNRVAMTDNIMPHRFHKTLIPALAEAGLDAHLFYEQKANLSLARVRDLVAAGVQTIQPGIEALVTPLLKRMAKGVLGRQNVALLRYAVATGLRVKWNLLHDFPGDEEDDYRSTLALVPLLRHLTPPNALTALALDRFSPYHGDPAAHGITDVAPLSGYADVFGAAAGDPETVARLAYHFTGEWESAARRAPDLAGALWGAVEAWKAAWDGEPPVLRVHRVGRSTYALTDTRGLTGDDGAPFPTHATLTEPQAAAVLVGGPRGKVPTEGWALRRGYAVDMDGWCVPLATADPNLLADMEARFGRRAAPRPLQVLRASPR
jgi:ribosomal peptide maturation radical SAM protein 1